MVLVWSDIVSVLPRHLLICIRSQKFCIYLIYALVL